MMEPTIHKFGDNDLQKVLVWVPPERSPESLFWIVFIHGGAWRDPMITACNFADPVVSKLLSNPTRDVTPPGKNKTLAIASLSYRLSPHPSCPQDPDASPRDAKHPDHLDDVCAGIDVLRRVYGLSNSDNYVLMGHSCGATLAFQAVKRHVDAGLPAPRALIGLAGIYDIKALVRNHSTGPYADVYESFIRGAFGDDEKVRIEASPSHFGSHISLRSPCTVLLVVADGDELVEPEQRMTMRATLLGIGEGLELRSPVTSHGNWRYSEISVPGGHDEMWEKGEIMVSVVERLWKILPGEDGEARV
ncbi:hypothetical protein H2204_005737 [Knufia peltigerae]|uniref:Kynurenine formamidase n=1 Tax=Knufia peltigerae TaxID=1002370 RepID=A0AA38Y4T5_9EURO|nr:hypothetical protein H2204_005737 [Knufia peltigerae]